MLNSSPLGVEFIDSLEEAIEDNSAIQLVLKNNQLQVFPKLCLYIGNAIHVIIESLDDGSLGHIPIKKIQSFFEIDTQKVCQASQKVLEHYIISLRNVEERNIRLILKVYSKDDFTLDVKYQYFGEQCTVTNGNGETIWAADIEMNPGILDWLQGLGPNIEILDPLNIKKDLLSYCEQKLKKLA